MFASSGKENSVVKKVFIPKTPEQRQEALQYVIPAKPRVVLGPGWAEYVQMQTANYGFTLVDVAAYLDGLCQSVRDGTPWENWGNPILHVQSGCGRSILSISVDVYAINVWDETGTLKIGVFKSVEDYAAYFRFRPDGKKTRLDMIEDGWYPCQECGEMVKREDGSHFSFAGFVCQKCYDPKRHLPPDTRGD